MSAAEIAAETVALDRKIAAYLAALDASDATERDDDDDTRTQAALAKLKQRRAELVELAETMAADERELGVVGEPEARPMGSGTGAKRPSYNVQTAVDPKSHIVLHHAVTTEATDNRLLHPMARAAKQVLEATTLTAIADKGYENARHAAACEAEKIDPAIPVPKPTNPRGDFSRRMCSSTTPSVTATLAQRDGSCCAMAATSAIRRIATRRRIVVVVR